MSKWELLPQDNVSITIEKIAIKGAGTIVLFKHYEDQFKLKMIYCQAFFNKYKEDKVENNPKKKMGGLSL